MDPFYNRLIIRAATIDELLSDDFETLPAENDSAERARRRLSAWCRSAASGDQALFARRLKRDGLDSAEVFARLSAVRRKARAPVPGWAEDAVWIMSAFAEGRRASGGSPASGAGPVAFEDLFEGIVEQAETMVRSGLDHKAANLQPSAYACLRRALFRDLSDLAAPALYERFSARRKTTEVAEPARPGQGVRTSIYENFVAEMRAGGIQQLFEDKPVLLRLVSTISRQWVDTSREFILRLGADLPQIRELTNGGGNGGVVHIEGGFSDPQNGGRSVKILTFADGAKIVYKPKDLQIDLAWQDLVARLNRAQAPSELMTARTLARNGYGWSSVVEHAGCAGADEFPEFFRRVGAWLALFHCFAANDMHQENVIATGSHPVPIDLETLLQSSLHAQKRSEPEDAAYDAAMEKLADSVMAAGLLPVYGRAPDDKVFAVGGVTADWNAKIRIKWENINSDDMRPARWKDVTENNPNLPHVHGRYAKFSDHVGDLISGFSDYARFLSKHRS